MAHITLKEILTQPRVWRQVLKLIINDKTAHKLAAHNAGEIVFIGCGSSYYLSLVAASYYTIVTGRKSRALPASEALLYPDTFITDDNAYCLPILISRSGTTTEVVKVAEYISSNYGVELLGISCRPGSDLLRVCAIEITLPHADEKCASSKHVAVI